MRATREMKKKIYEEEVVAAIKRHKYMRFHHIDFSELSFSKSTAYEYKLELSEKVREALELNRRKAVNYLLQKWIASDNPTLQIAAMRLVADEEERAKLNQQYIEATQKSDRSFLPIDLTIKSKENDKSEKNKTEQEKSENNKDR